MDVNVKVNVNVSVSVKVSVDVRVSVRVDQGAKITRASAVEVPDDGRK